MKALSAGYRPAGGPLNLLVDSTGIKFFGDGEWQARKHGVQGRRQWCKVHLAMDTATSDIRAVEFTPSRETAEIHIRAALSNRFNALGTAEIVRVA